MMTSHNVIGSKNDDDVSERHWLQEHWSRQKRKVHLQTTLALDPNPNPKSSSALLFISSHSANFPFQLLHISNHEYAPAIPA